MTREEVEKQKKNLENLLELIDCVNKKELYKKLVDYLEKKECICLVKKIEDRIVGLLWAYEREFNSEKRVHINYFSVLREFQNKKIGKELLNKIIEIAKLKKINYIDLNVDEGNKQARFFYEKNKFKVEKVLMKLNI